MIYFLFFLVRQCDFTPINWYNTGQFEKMPKVNSYSQVGIVKSIVECESEIKNDQTQTKGQEDLLLTFW